MAFFREMEFKDDFVGHSGGYYITGWDGSAMVVSSRHDGESAAPVFPFFSNFLIMACDHLRVRWMNEGGAKVSC
jgi:hypothetical protein